MASSSFFSAFLKKLGQSKLVQDLGAATIQAIHDAAQSLEHASEKLDTAFKKETVPNRDKTNTDDVIYSSTSVSAADFKRSANPLFYDMPAPVAKKSRVSKKTPDFDGQLYRENDVLMGIAPGQTTLIIPDTIHEVGRNAFNQGNELTTVVFKGFLRAIGPCAFLSLQNLKTVIFEDDVLSIGKHAFKDCIALEHLEFQKDLTELHEQCFANCSTLEEIDLPDTCNLIEKECFYACRSLKRIHLPKNLTVLSQGLFSYCTSLEEIELPQECDIDKHHYPKIEAHVFSHTLRPQYWERFESNHGYFLKKYYANSIRNSDNTYYERYESHNDVLKRVRVDPAIEDPEGLLNMILPGKDSPTSRILQSIVYDSIHYYWEYTLGAYPFSLVMDILLTCFRFARVFTADLEDDRAQRLAILYALCDGPFGYLAFVDHSWLMPYAILETLRALCGQGEEEKRHDREIIELAAPFYGQDPQANSMQDYEYEDTEFVRRIYEELPNPPDRYDPHKTRFTIIAEFYSIMIHSSTFSMYMSSLAESIFHKYRLLDLGSHHDSTLDHWCRVWNRFLHENYSLDHHVVKFTSPEREMVVPDNSWTYVTILSDVQLLEIQGILTKIGWEDLMTIYSDDSAP